MIKRAAKQNKYVLFIEDDPALQKVCRLKFAEKGVELRIVNDGQEALDMLKNDKAEMPSIIILDLLLPYVSGIDVLNAIRKTKKWADIPVVVLTNADQKIDEAKGRVFAEQLALLLQAAILIKQAPDFIADAFCKVRLSGERHLVWGGIASDIAVEKIIKRHSLT